MWCMPVWRDIFIIAFMHIKFDIAFFILVVVCLLKFSLLSSIPPRYFTSELICTRSLPAISGELDTFSSCTLEPNVMYSILFAFNFYLIWSIQDFTVPNVALSFSFVDFSFCLSEAGSDFLSEWSLANPFMMISSSMTLSVKAL